MLYKSQEIRFFVRRNKRSIFKQNFEAGFGAKLRLPDGGLGACPHSNLIRLAQSDDPPRRGGRTGRSGAET